MENIHLLHLIISRLNKTLIYIVYCTGLKVKARYHMMSCKCCLKEKAREQQYTNVTPKTANHYRALMENIRLHMSHYNCTNTDLTVVVNTPTISIKVENKGRE